MYGSISNVIITPLPSSHPFASTKTKQNIFIHTSVFVSFSSIDTKMLKNDENDWDLELRMC